MGQSAGRRVDRWRFWALRFRLMVERGPHSRPQDQKEKRSMDHSAGLDVSVKETSICIVDDTGRIVREVKVASEPEALLQVLTNPGYHFKRIGLEAGPLSQWLFSALAEAGLPVITPLNDSFVDFDVLGIVDPETFPPPGPSHYSQMVEEARRQRQLLDDVTPDWIVLRNRLSMLGSRNKRFIGEALHELSQRLNFRCIEGLAERVIFREFYPRGLTAVDDLDEI